MQLRSQSYSRQLQQSYGHRDSCVRKGSTVTQGSAAVNRQSEWNARVKDDYSDTIIVTVTITRTKERFADLQQNCRL